MCGIAGFVKSAKSTLDCNDYVNQIASILEHRGPDGFGTWRNDANDLYLTHRRLSILELSPLGKQPMTSKSGRYIITFNGEIYNYLELKKKLAKQNVAIVSNSDTEVLLAGIEAWGVEATLNAIEGMFAFCLFDQEQQKIILARDRMGEKPLFYGFIDGNFMFTSELRVLKYFQSKLKTSSSALSYYFKYGYIPYPLSVYEGIYKLVPGCYFEFSLEQLRQQQSFSPYPDNLHSNRPHQYWKMEFNMSEQAISNPKEQLHDILKTTISHQLLSDVPLGSFLSGGIDSTLVTAIASKISKTPLKTFTVGFTDKDYNESNFAKLISEHLGTNHHEYIMDPNDILELMPKFGKIVDEPLANPSIIPSYLLSKFAREHVTVCLSGDGGDELFCGYNRYLYADKVDNVMSRLSFLPKALPGKIVGSIPKALLLNIVKLANKNKSISNLEGKLQKLVEISSLNSKQEIYDYLLSFWNINELMPSPTTSAYVDQLYNLPNTDHYIESMMHIDAHTYLPGDNLQKVDTASMLASLETRLPLLNHRLIEFSQKIPVSDKLKFGKSKWPLRDILYEYVPKNLVERPKMGFSVPLAGWLRNDLKEFAGDIFNSSSLDKFDFLNTKTVRKTWQEHLTGKYNWDLKLWSILVYLQWHNENL